MANIEVKGYPFVFIAYQALTADIIVRKSVNWELVDWELID